jgi:hypothetical protein
MPLGKRLLDSQMLVKFNSNSSRQVPAVQLGMKED